MIRRPLFVLALALAALPALTSIADACGGFFRARSVPAEQTPSLSREKVLIIHDEVGGREHFVREVAFARAAEPFGFVVPTPTRPEVEPVKKQPFTALRQQYPFRQPPSQQRGYTGAPRGGGSGGGVEVLEQKKVGSFTAFVLAATDAEALATWLKDNELVSTPEADAWLAHYVEMGFYYVAMRYDPPADGAEGAGTIAAETIRISFDTAIPYYPYLEPDRPIDPDVPARVMELWYVGTRQVVPIGLHAREWVRPLESGLVAERARATLEGLLATELDVLLPSGELVVQTFQDQKRGRAGHGDILFASKEGRTLTQPEREAIRPLLGILDPALRGTEGTR